MLIFVDDLSRACGSHVWGMGIKLGQPIIGNDKVSDFPHFTDLGAFAVFVRYLTSFANS